jgi:hypothetical protein
MDDIKKITNQLDKQFGPLPKLPQEFDRPLAEGVHDEGGKIISAKADIQFVPEDIPALAKEYTFVSLGPMYELAGIQHSIPDQLSAEINYTFDAKIMQTSAPVCRDLNHWHNLITCIPTEKWDVFKKNLLSIVTIRHDKDHSYYWETTLHTMPFWQKYRLYVAVPIGNICQYSVTKVDDVSYMLVTNQKPDPGCCIRAQELRKLKGYK